MDKKYENLSEGQRLRLYQLEKSKIQNIGLTPLEYEQEILKICRKLGI